MRSKPIQSPPPQPKKAYGRVLDDDAPVDDYENAVRARDEEERQRNRGPSPPNRSAARHGMSHAPHPTKGRKGTTGSKYRSRSRH